MRRIGRAVVTGLLVVAAVGGWLLFAPQPLGGPVAYVVTDGISMQPDLRDGDLVLVRRASDYDVGDVAAYDSASLGRVVLHRIVDTEGDAFVFQGDNNDFLDGERPTIDALVGKKWLVVPGAGKVLAWVGQPLTASILAGLIALVLFLGIRSKRKGGARAARPRRGAGVDPGPVLVALVAVAAVAGVLWARPSTRSASHRVDYGLEGSFTYSSPVERTTVYPTGRVETGEPVFLKLVDRLTVGYEQKLASEAEHSVGGAGSLVAVLSDSSGWSHVETLQAETDFQGDELALEGSLDLDAFARVIARLQHLTGVQEPYYRLSIQPDVTMAGVVAGRPITERLSTPLVFQIDAFKMKVVANEPLSPNAAPQDPLRPTRPGAVRVTDSEPNDLTLAGRTIPLEPARIVVTALAGMLLLGLLFALRGGPEELDEPGRIADRYRGWIVEASQLESGPPRKAIRMSSFEELARVAERYDRMILHDSSDGVHSYIVEEQGVAYFYQWVSPGALRTSPSAQANVHRLVPPAPATRPTGTTTRSPG